MNEIKKIMLFLRHISFIIFIVSITILYSGFFKYKFGKICLFLSFVYILLYFVFFLLKNKNEQGNMFNNFVLMFLHIYVSYIAYRYMLVANDAFTNGTTYFAYNFFVIALCLFVLSFNEIIICNTK